MDSFLTSTFAVLIAEMGDKTQLLGMAFATVFPWRSVLAGVFVATVANHWFAVLAGSLLTGWLTPELLQLGSAFLFIFFGLWTLWGDTLDNNALAKSSRSPFWTVAIAFFLAEMGDKTQILTLVLAAEHQAFFPVWAGSTTGMMLSNGFGIWIGVVLGKRIPARTVQWCSALLFIGFGVFTLWERLPQSYITSLSVTGFIAFLALAIFIAWREGQKKSLHAADYISCPIDTEEEISEENLQITTEVNNN